MITPHNRPEDVRQGCAPPSCVIVRRAFAPFRRPPECRPPERDNPGGADLPAAPSANWASHSRNQGGTVPRATCVEVGRVSAAREHATNGQAAGRGNRAVRPLPNSQATDRACPLRPRRRTNGPAEGPKIRCLCDAANSCQHGASRISLRPHPPIGRGPFLQAWNGLNPGLPAGETRRIRPLGVACQIFSPTTCRWSSSSASRW
jgi:hypothetical protein